MKPKDILPSGRICLSEKLLVAGLSCSLLGWGLIAVAMFLDKPVAVSIVVVVLICLGVQRRRQSRSTTGVHGDAHWANADEILAAGLIGGTGAILGKLPNGPRPDPFISLKIIGTRFKSVGRMRYLVDRLVMPARSKDAWAVRSLVRIPDSDKVAHAACLLPTGVGKTHRVLTAGLFQSSQNAVVYDPSGTTLRATAEFRRKEFGHEIRFVDPFNVSGMPESDQLNVLDLIDPDHPGYFDFCNFLGHALIADHPESQREPFWHAATVFATVFILLAIILNDNKRYRNLLSLGGLLNGERLQALARGLADHPNSALRRRAEQMLNYQGKTLSSLLSCLSNEHAWLDSPAYSAALSESTFKLQSLFERPMTLYLVIPGHRAMESAPFIRTLLTAILFTAFEMGPDIHRPPVHFYLDEAATFGKLDLLMTLYTQGRKYGLRSINFFQSVGQVAEIVGTPDKIQTFRAQMGIEMFKAHDYQTAKEVSEWIGNKTVQTKSKSWQETTNSGWSNSTGGSFSQGRSGGWSDGTTVTVSETGVPVIRPEQVLQLRQHEAVVLAAGIPPVKVNILDAADVDRCADAQATHRYQKSYLRRVRFNAFIFCLFGAVQILGGGFLTAVGIRDAWRRNHPVAMPVDPAVQNLVQWPPVSQPGRIARPEHVPRQQPLPMPFTELFPKPTKRGAP